MLDFRMTVDHNLKELPKDMMDGLFEGMQKAILLAEKTTKDVYLSGKALHRRTGFLYSSIGNEVKITGTKVIGSVGTLKYVVDYAGVWEYGGRFAARPFLKPSFEDNMEAMLEILGRSTTEKMNE
jgi:hypothetical protein